MRRKSERTSSSSTSSRRSSRRKQTEENIDDEDAQMQQDQTQAEAEVTSTVAEAELNNDEQSEKVSENEKSQTGVEVVITKRTKTSTQQPDSSSDREESDADTLSTRRTPSKRARTPNKGKHNTRRNRMEKIETIKEENGNEDKQEIEPKDKIITESENKPIQEENNICLKEVIIVAENIQTENSDGKIKSKADDNKEADSGSSSGHKHIELPVIQKSEVEIKKDEDNKRSQKTSKSPVKKINEEEPKEVKKPRRSRFDERPKDLQAEIEQNKISEELKMDKSKNISKPKSDELNEIPREQILDKEKDKETSQEQAAEILNHKKPIEKVIEKPQRKRKWLSRKPSGEQILAITTDSLKELISDVHPVPLSDVKLDSSPEHEEVSIVIDEKTLAVVNCDEDNDTDGKNHHASHDLSSPKHQRQHSKDRSVNAFRRSNSRDRSAEKNSRELKTTISTNRKISIVDKARPPSPSRNITTSILYITNLVRPFTVLQLKGLLARTGKIVEENGFWIDRIKSKCFVRYETEDEAIETRHALHGVRWPTSNPKCLNVDFGTEAAIDKAIASTLDEQPKINRDSVKENRVIGSGWEKDRLDFDREKREIQIRPVREWDVGKKDEFEREIDRNRGRNDRNGGRNLERDKDQLLDRDREERRERDRNRDQRDRERRQSSDRENIRRRSDSGSPVRKYKKKENDPPLRLLDDLFRKTKTTPCVYWLPLTSEQIAEKEQTRQKRIEEREKIRQEREREREKERREKRSRSRNKRY